MQTSFSDESLTDPAMQVSESILRKCVHCGFCTATCPTYVLLGDELDSPRGRIYLIKDMLENQRKPSAKVVKHIDRCLSCLSCMTTCPSGVNYMHLVDHARAYITEHYKRPFIERFYRRLLALILPFPSRFRATLRLAPLGKALVPLMRKFAALRPLAAMLDLAPRHQKARATPQLSHVTKPKGRVAILQGCAEPVLRPEIRDATTRVLNRCGYDVVSARGEACCGALVHHMGFEADALDAARKNVDAWMREIESGGLDAIIITASGCGTTIKNYGFLLRHDPDYAERAEKVSLLAQDITEFLDGEDRLPEGNGIDLVVAYHAACSLQHGQKVKDAPARLLKKAGFAVRIPTEAHLCCGSAGTYNILQPQIASQLGRRKADNLECLQAAVIATGNIGCATQLDQFSAMPVVHTIELLDWALGGPIPASMDDWKPQGQRHPLSRASGDR